jgi:hypothetical protein
MHSSIPVLLDDTDPTGCWSVNEFSMTSVTFLMRV